MSFFIKDEKVGEQYKQIWSAIKNKINIKFHSKPIYEIKYLKTKIREYDCLLKTNFLDNDIPKENMHYTCIACITIDLALKIDKKIIHNFIQKSVSKYRAKNKQMSRFINTELKSDSEADSQPDSKSDAELMAKLKSDFDSDSE